MGVGPCERPGSPTQVTNRSTLQVPKSGRWQSETAQHQRLNTQACKHPWPNREAPSPEPASHPQAIAQRAALQQQSSQPAGPLGTCLLDGGAHGVLGPVRQGHQAPRVLTALACLGVKWGLGARN